MEYLFLGSKNKNIKSAEKIDSCSLGMLSHWCIYTYNTLMLTWNKQIFLNFLLAYFKINVTNLKSTNLMAYCLCCL